MRACVRHAQNGRKTLWDPFDKATARSTRSNGPSGACRGRSESVRAAPGASRERLGSVLGRPGHVRTGSRRVSEAPRTVPGASRERPENPRAPQWDPAASQERFWGPFGRPNRSVWRRFSAHFAPLVRCTEPSRYRWSYRQLTTIRPAYARTSFLRPSNFGAFVASLQRSFLARLPVST